MISIVRSELAAVLPHHQRRRHVHLSERISPARYLDARIDLSQELGGTFLLRAEEEQRLRRKRELRSGVAPLACSRPTTVQPPFRRDRRY